MSNRPGAVTFDAVSPNLPTLRFHLLDDDTLTGGVGGWQAVARPRRKSSAEWVGTDPWSLTLPLLANGMEMTVGHDQSVESKLRALITMATKRPTTGQPAILRVSGPIRVPSTRMQWVIQSIEWGTQVRNKAGQRVYQEFTVELLEYVEAAVLLSPAKAAKKRNSGNWAQQIRAAQKAKK